MNYQIPPNFSGHDSTRFLKNDHAGYFWTNEFTIKNAAMLY